MSKLAQRILEVVADGAIGGGTAHVLQILEGLRGEFQLGLVTEPGSYAALKASALGVEVFPIDLFSRSPLEIGRLRKAAATFRPDLIHAQGSRGAFWTGLMLGGAERIYTVHGYHFLHRGKLARWLGRAADRYVSAHGSRVVFVSEYDARLAQKEALISPGTRTTVIYNGIPIPSKWPERRSVKKRIGFIGRLVPQKDPGLFIRAMATLPDHQGVIIGSGVLERHLRSEIRHQGLSNVEILGPMDPEQVQEAMANLDVLLITSRWEGLPYLVLEAFRAGVSVVAAKVGGIPEMIKDGESGLLVEARQPEDYASAVRRLTSNPETREHIVQTARAVLSERFSQDAMLGRLTELYTQILAPMSGRRTSSHG